MGTPIPETPGRFALVREYPANSEQSHDVSSRECLAVVLHAECRLRSIVNGRETSRDLRAGMVGVVPPDQARHTVVVTTQRPSAAFLLLFPRVFVQDVLRAEGMDADPGVGDEMDYFHPGMHRLLSRLQASAGADIMRPSADEDDVRRLLIHAIGRLTGRTPDWERDSRGFDSRTMGYVTDMIDAHLACPPRLTDIALATGYSPGHCAKKIRRATGSSYDRLCNFRRCVAALVRLRHDDVPLATLAYDLGFSSQSKLTTVFRRFTGMSPAVWRKESRPAARRMIP